MNNFPKSLPAFVNYLLEAILAPFRLGRTPLVLDFYAAALTSLRAANPVPVIYFSITNYPNLVAWNNNHLLILHNFPDQGFGQGSARWFFCLWGISWDHSVVLASGEAHLEGPSQLRSHTRHLGGDSGNAGLTWSLLPLPIVSEPPHLVFTAGQSDFLMWWLASLSKAKGINGQFSWRISPKLS